MPPPQNVGRFFRHSDLTDEYFFKMYQIYIEYVRHENDLMNQRTTWSMTVQGGLLVILVYLLQKFFDINPALADSAAPLRDEHRQLFNLLIVVFWIIVCGLGLAVSSFSQRSINAAIAAQRELNLIWKVNFLERAEALKFPRLMGGGSVLADDHGGLLARSLPPILVGVWIIFFLFAVLGLVSLWSNIPYMIAEKIHTVTVQHDNTE